MISFRRPTKRDTRDWVADAVRESGARCVHLLDGGDWGYTKVLRKAGFSGRIVAHEIDPAEARRMRSTAPELRASVREGCIVEAWAAEECKGVPTALLLDLYAFLPWGAWERLLGTPQSRALTLITATAPAGRKAPGGAMRQSQYTARLQKILESHNFELTLAVGYKGEPFPGVDPAKKTMPMMYFEARRRGGPPALGPQFYPSEIRPVVRNGKVAHCDVRWYGYGADTTREPAEFYFRDWQ